MANQNRPGFRCFTPKDAPGAKRVCIKIKAKHRLATFKKGNRTCKKVPMKDRSGRSTGCYQLLCDGFQPTAKQRHSKFYRGGSVWRFVKGSRTCPR